MWCQVFLCIKGLGAKLTLHYILSIMGLEMAVKSPLCGEGQFTTLRCARELLGLVCLLVFLEQLVVPKALVAFITHKGGGIHMFGSDMGLNCCSSTLQRLLAQRTFFISYLHSLNNIFHLVLLIGSACIHPKCLQYFYLHIMDLLTFPDLGRVNIELGGGVTCRCRWWCWKRLLPFFNRAVAHLILEVFGVLLTQLEVCLLFQWIML